MNKLGVIVFLIFFWLPEIGVAQESDYPLDWFLRDVEQD